METAEALLQFVINHQDCNVKFKVKCGDSWIPYLAHKLVLSMWSPAFEDKFFKNANSFYDEIEIVDILPSSFQAFLRFLYNSSSELEDNRNDIELVLDVYKAANKYQVQRLKTFCCDILDSTSVNKKNVFKVMDAAFLIDSYILKNRCFKVLQTETRAILNLHSLDKIRLPMVRTLLQVPSLSLSSEFELLTWVFKWAKFQLVEAQTINDPREFITPLLPYLNFTALASEDFAKLVSNNAEFFDKVDCFNVFMNISIPEWADLPPWYDKNKNLRKYKKDTTNVIDKSFPGDFAPKAELDHLVKNSMIGTNDEFSSVNNKASDKQSLSHASYSCIVMGTDSTVNGNASIMNIMGTDSTVNGNASIMNIMGTDSTVNGNDSIMNIECSIENTKSLIEIGNVTEEVSNKVSSPSTLRGEIVSATDNKTNLTGSIVEFGNLTEHTYDHAANSTVTSEEIMSVVSSKTNLSEPIVGTGNITVDSKSGGSSSINTSSMLLHPIHNIKMGKDNTETFQVLFRVNQNCSNGSLSITGEMKQDDFERAIPEKGDSWNSLIPTVFRKKIKKRKVKKFYLLLDSKSMPAIGRWNPEIASLICSGNYRILVNLIEKQQYHSSL